jgi:hypothetical protein
VRGNAGVGPPFLTSTLDGGEWLSSRPGRFTPTEIAPRHQFYMRLGEPHSRSGRYGKDKTLLPLPGIDTVRPALRYADWSILALST